MGEELPDGMDVRLSKAILPEGVAGTEVAVVALRGNKHQREVQTVPH